MTINNFDLYYQDVQERIKNQKFLNKDVAQNQKIDITIVVDMLLTGFDSKFLNTLYVDKNLKYHGLIQAFSRTNRVLNDTKPYGNIIDFRQQNDEVDNAIRLFSGKLKDKKPREVWLVDPAPKVIKRLEEAVNNLKQFMSLHDLEYKPEEVDNIKGDIARCEFINRYKEIQRLKTQLNQYTELKEEEKEEIENLLPNDMHISFRSKYLETAQKLVKEKFSKGNIKDDDVSKVIEQTDFEFVLFSSTIIDYDYIMKLISNLTQPNSKIKVNRKQLLDMLYASSNLMEEKDDIRDYIQTLQENIPLSEEEIRKKF